VDAENLDIEKILRWTRTWGEGETGVAESPWSRGIKHFRSTCEDSVGMIKAPVRTCYSLTSL